MSSVREVVIEIMRHGPPHNQLLSETTRYLALCGAHPAETLTIDTEHRKVVHLLSRMALEPEAAARHEYEREELRKLVTSLLAQLPALPNETRTSDDTLIHLRLTITAQELALLPFELADAPPGVSHSRQPLLIGPEPDVLLTREVRRSARPNRRMPDWFKVLVVASDPEQLGLPLAATLQILEQVLTPFGPPGLYRGELVPHLENRMITVLRDASLDEVRECCHRETYSHVHFLAHGAELPGRTDAFGMSLWDKAKEKREIVDGDDLVRAVTPPQADGGWSSPWCITLATCDSDGKEAVPLWPQTSLAHALHEAGIPTVIASQYPLTFGAAVEMTRALYEGELRGDDIRFTLRSMRHRIASRMRTTYDWASLAIYASWPEDLDAQSAKLRPLRSVQRLEVANKWADTAIARLEEGRSGAKGAHATDRQAARSALDRLKDVAPRLEREVARIQHERLETRLRWQGRQGGHWFNKRHEKDVSEAGTRVLYVEFCGLLGSAWKRIARLRHLLGERESNAALGAMRESADWYLRGTAEDRGTHWTPCQAFVMCGLLLEPGRPVRRSWRLALRNARDDLDRELSAQNWAHSSLIEVELWRRSLLGEQGKAAHHVRELIRLAGADSFAVHATRRQLLRYSDWWAEADYAPGCDEQMKKEAEELLELFPPVDEKRIELDELASASLLDGLGPPADLNANVRLGADRVAHVHLGESPAKDGPFFRVQMLPARAGDALWIEYGWRGAVHRILIDGGYRTTIQSVKERIRKIASESTDEVCRFDLVVVTHIDADHIEGIIELLGTPLPIRIDDLWYNGRRHLPGTRKPVRFRSTDPLGGKHGLFLDTLIARLDTRWNGAFGGGAVAVSDGGKPPTVELPGDMRLTLLSPTRAALADLAPAWDRHVARHKLDKATVAQVLEAMEKLHYDTRAARDTRSLKREKPEGAITEEMVEEYLRVDDSKDPAKENGASIAFLAEFAGRSVLFTGDAHAEVLIKSIGRLVRPKRRLAVGAVKLTHHGSRNNVSSALLEVLRTRTFLVSTNGGSSHYHPDREAIARVVAGGWRGQAKNRARIRLLFNYDSDYTRPWNVQALRDKYRYDVHFPGDADVLELEPVPKPPKR